MTTLPVIAAVAFAAAGIGTLGGLGGAVLLVPVLVLSGLDPADAVPLGLLAVAGGSLAASAAQIEVGLVHHRLGIVTETAASAGAIAGALLAGMASPDALRLVLAAVALVAGGFGGIARLAPETAPPAFVAETPGEWPGTLAGTVNDRGTPVAYEARRRPVGIALMGSAGFVAGLSGTSGGYLKTPIMTSVMSVPAKVAAATTTFTVGITASAALVVFLIGGTVDLQQAAAAVAGALPGGRAGALLQARVEGRTVQLALSAALVAIAIALVATA